MKILHVIPSIAPRDGGPSQAVFAMCRAVARRGIDVAIATTDADGPRRLPVVCERLAPFDGVPTIFFRRQATESFKYAPRLARWLASNVESFDAVHIHAVFSYASLAAARVCRRRSVPYVVRPLGTLTPWSISRKRVRKILMWHFAAADMIRGAAAVHYATEDERRGTERSLRVDRGIVVALGVDDDLLRVLPDSGDDSYILILSRLHPVKRVELSLDAVLTLLREPRFARWRLIIAGDGEPRYVETLKAIASRAPVGDRVHFAGWLQGSAKYDVLRNADLLLLPSLHESFGLSIVEALACAVPVVVSPQVALAEDVRESEAGWVLSTAPESLYGTLSDAMTSGSERTRRGACGRRMVERRYTWSRVAGDLAALYASITSGATAAPFETLVSAARRS